MSIFLLNDRNQNRLAILNSDKEPIRGSHDDRDRDRDRHRDRDSRDRDRDRDRKRESRSRDRDRESRDREKSSRDRYSRNEYDKHRYQSEYKKDGKLRWGPGHPDFDEKRDRLPYWYIVKHSIDDPNRRGWRHSTQNDTTDLMPINKWGFDKDRMRKDVDKNYKGNLIKISQNRRHKVRIKNSYAVGYV